MKNSTIENLYDALLYLYPEKYRQNYSQEMRLVFREMYQDKVKEQGRIGLGFWLKISWDLIQSTIERHIESVGQLGFKKYGRDILHINGLNIIAFFLLLPFGLAIFIDMVSRIIQWNFSHPNHAFYAAFSHTPLYYQLVLFTWVLVFPVLSVLLNLVFLVLITQRGNLKIISLPFLKVNFFSILFLLAGLMCLGIVWGHDIVPCVGHGIFSQGVGNLFGIVNYCRMHA